MVTRGRGDAAIAGEVEYDERPLAVYRARAIQMKKLAMQTGLGARGLLLGTEARKSNQHATLANAARTMKTGPLASSRGDIAAWCVAFWQQGQGTLSYLPASNWRIFDGEQSASVAN